VEEGGIDFEIFVTPGLGDNSYLIRSCGQAVIVDPQRDVWRFLRAAEKEKLTCRYILETHVHNDYVSGACAIRAATGAEIAAPARGAYRFPHRALAEGDEIRVGNLRFVALETPGHTPEHLAYLVFEAGRKHAVAVFSGGSLIVGSAGRTDLLGEGCTEELTRAQFHSLQRIVGFGDDLQVLPTHGAGSFCAATVPGLQRTSTLAAERERNPALRVPDEEAFLRQQLSGLLAFPAYYRHMAPINRGGPVVLRTVPDAALLAPARVEHLITGGAWIVDLRDRLDFARGHIPGSVNIELNNTFATYVGWVVPFDAPMILVLPDDSAWQEARTQLLRIGYDRVVGYLNGGIDAWRGEGRAVNSYPVAEIDDLCRACLSGQSLQILDVRQGREWDQGHIPEKSLHVFVGDLPEHLGELPRNTEFWTICASGYRAAIAASLLDREGLAVRLVGRGGVPEWAAHCYPQVGLLGKQSVMAAADLFAERA
jgi:hydroxyacylglutathione hydrolase